MLFDKEMLGMGYFNGSIVFVSSFVASDMMGRLLAGEGAIGMVLRVHVLGEAGVGLEHPRWDFSFPSLELCDTDFVDVMKMIQERDVVFAHISTSPFAEDLFERYATEAAFMNIFFGGVYVIVFFLILYHIIIEIRDIGPQLSLKFAIGIILLLLNLARLCFLVVDPLTKHRAIGWRIVSLFYGLHMFFSILGMAIITIYWFEVINRDIMKMKTLKSISLPYYVMNGIYFVCVILWVIVLCADYSGELFQWLNNIIICVLGSTFMIMVIFQFVTATVIVGRKRQLENGAKREHNSSVFATKILVISLIQIFLFPLFLLYSLSTDDLLTTLFISAYWVCCASDSLLILSLIEWGKHTHTVSSGRHR
eukprot:TRINITY_DN755_c0_g1_i2.p1 TRINITY_DN755_c0_g1~~TRINITY_DN755_c0_g1_i2.p1  ORF type:complete len:365 (-),score=47.04 TRINITY_DN755_c0_g1_i2:12-1106(-)